MSSYVCSRCGVKGPVLLRADQFCRSCVSNWTWASFADNNQPITVTSETLAAQDPKPPEKPTAHKAGIVTWMLLLLSLLFSAIVVVLLGYFFAQPPTYLSGEKILNRFHNLALSAGILALLAVVISVGHLYFARHKKYHFQTPLRIVRAISVILAMGVFVGAFVCWSKTERVGSLYLQQPHPHALVQRLHNATVVVQAHEPLASRYRSSKRAGTIIGAESGRMWILTVPYSDNNGKDLSQPNDVWVNLSDGRTLPGRFSWAARKPVNLAIVEVRGNTPPAQVQFHPTAEGIIPSQSVLVIPNPLQGWGLEQGTILSRGGQRTSIGWNCTVKVSLGLQQLDRGSAMYDESGRLLGLMTSSDERGGNSVFVIVDSATISAIEGITNKTASGRASSLQEQ
jgi:hypothetical protein